VNSRQRRSRRYGGYRHYGGDFRLRIHFVWAVQRQKVNTRVRAGE